MSGWLRQKTFSVWLRTSHTHTHTHVAHNSTASCSDCHHSGTELWGEQNMGAIQYNLSIVRGKDCRNMSGEGLVSQWCASIHFTDNETLKREWRGINTCVLVSATYVHFALVNNIEVVSFIAWMWEKRRNRSLWVTRKKQSGKMSSVEPTGELLLLLPSTLYKLEVNF